MPVLLRQVLMLFFVVLLFGCSSVGGQTLHILPQKEEQRQQLQMLRGEAEAARM
jgi:hypothetical protein